MRPEPEVETSADETRLSIISSAAGCNRVCLVQTVLGAIDELHGEAGSKA